MASSGGISEARSGATTVPTTSASYKLKRTPVILNIPRKPEVAHFKVLQWNVLADGLAQNGDFCRVPPGCLEWEYRRPLLIQEILEANADIICLQELNHFDELHGVLSSLGYDGAFREKHASPALKYEYPPDGMAVFYRRSRFRCCSGGVEGRSFQDDATGREQSQGYLQILLTDLVVGREVLVVTTHLKAKDGAECEELRYQQASQLLRNVAETLQRLQHRPQQQQQGMHQQRRQQGSQQDDGSQQQQLSASGNEGGSPARGCGGGDGEQAAEAVSGNGGGGTGTGTSTSSGRVEAVNGGWAGRGGHDGGGNGVGARGSESATRAGGAGSSCNGSGNGHGNGNGNGNGVTGRGAGVRVGVGGGGSGGGGGFCPVVPLVVTGDFNTMPGSKTCEAFRNHPLGLLSLWEQRPQDATLSSSDLDFQPPSKPTPPTSGAAAAAAPPQPLPQATRAPAAAAAAGGQALLLSAPPPVLPWRPEFSTWKFRVKGESKRISDYIWFSGCGALRPLQRWRMLTEEEIGPTALPCVSYASDHVSLCCEFEWDVDSDLEWAPSDRELDWGEG